jgi:amidohydrolase
MSQIYTDRNSTMSIEQEIADKKQEVYEKIDLLRPLLGETQRDVHKHPELQFEELYASSLLADLTKAEGFTIEKPIGGLDTAFKAEYKKDADFPVVAFLSEYDALPGLGHACGHNLIATASLGAALGLSKLSSLSGTVQLIGTPAEEGGGGKVILANKGVFDDVDAAFIFHPANKNQLWKYAMASKVVKIEFFGKASHSASSPEMGINALDAIIQTFNNINALRQHVKTDVRIHGIITDGGIAPNIVPDYASALFYIRSLDDTYFEEVVEKVRNCANGAALATGSKLSFIQQESYKTLKTNMPLSDAFQKNAEALGIVFDENEPFDDLGSTDMGDVSHIAPSIHPYLTIGPVQMMYHTKEFAQAAVSEFGFETMITAAKALASTAIDFLMNEQFREKVNKDFKKEWKVKQMHP